MTAKIDDDNIEILSDVKAQAACPPGTVATQTSICGCQCQCCCPSKCCKCLRYTYKCGKNLNKCPKIPCAKGLLSNDEKINTSSYVQKAGKYGQIINNKINYREIWNDSEKTVDNFPEFSFEPIYSKDGKFSFGEPEWDENGNLFAGVNLAAGSVPCPVDCAILTIIFCVQGGCLTCPIAGRIKASCDLMMTAEVTSNPQNKHVNININNSGEVAFIKKDSYIKIDVSISDRDPALSEHMNVGPFPPDCPCVLACCECVAFGILNPATELIKNKIIYRTKNLHSNKKTTFFNKEHLTRIASQRLKKLKKT